MLISISSTSKSIKLYTVVCKSFSGSHKCENMFRWSSRISFRQSIRGNAWSVWKFHFKYEKENKYLVNGCGYINIFSFYNLITFNWLPNYLWNMLFGCRWRYGIKIIFSQNKFFREFYARHLLSFNIPTKLNFIPLPFRKSESPLDWRKIEEEEEEKIA